MEQFLESTQPAQHLGVVLTGILPERGKKEVRRQECEPANSGINETGVRWRLSNKGRLQ
jgi:hypothetical protein